MVPSAFVFRGRVQASRVESLSLAIDLRDAFYFQVWSRRRRRWARLRKLVLDGNVGEGRRVVR